MAIIGTLPYNITAGQPVSAAPVMADFNWIVNQVNANVPALIPANAGVTYVSTVGGTANAITLTPASALGGYAAGQGFTFKAPGDSSGAVTVNTSGLGARNLLYPDGSAMTGWELRSGQIIQIADNGSNYVLMSSPGTSGIQTGTCGISFGGASVGVTYSTNTITWIKQGRFVEFTADVTTTSNGSSTGNFLVTGLPYVINAGWAAGLNKTFGSVWLSFGTFTAGMLSLLPVAGDTTVGVVNSIAAGGAAVILNKTNFGSPFQIVIEGYYLV